MRYRVVIPSRPVAKGRARVGKNGRVHTPRQTVVAEAWVRMRVVEAVGTPRVEGPVAVRVDYVLEVPRSWPKRKQADALAGRVLPTSSFDLDNLAKLTCDALLGIAWVDDGQIVSMELTKRYGSVAHTVLEWGPFSRVDLSAVL